MDAQSSKINARASERDETGMRGMWSRVLDVKRVGAAPHVFVLSAMLFLVAGGWTGWRLAMPLLLGPRIECGVPVHDFGAVRARSVVRHQFVLRNTGRSTLVITSVRAACGGCTKCDLDKKVVSPGGNATLTVQLDLGGLRGEQRKEVMVSSNDPRRRLLSLSLRARVSCERLPERSRVPQ